MISQILHSTRQFLPFHRKIMFRCHKISSDIIDFFIKGFGNLVALEHRIG